jgi:hypothetical protein
MATFQNLDADAALAEGRKAYADKRHKKALECFTRVRMIYQFTTTTILINKGYRS